LQVPHSADELASGRSAALGHRCGHRAPRHIIDRALPHGCANVVASSKSGPRTAPKSHYFDGGSAAIYRLGAVYAVAARAFSQLVKAALLGGITCVISSGRSP
jgi:hypothetical protein